MNFQYDKKNSTLNIYLDAYEELKLGDVKELVKIVPGLEFVNAHTFDGKAHVLYCSWSNEGGSLTVNQVFPKPVFTPDAKVFKPVNSRNITPIANVETDKRHTIVGTVSMVDVRPLRTEKVLIKIGLCDETGGIFAKYFAENASEAKHFGAIKIGSRVKLTGSVSFDTFDNEICMMISNINVLPQSDKRQDLASRKRVELHCHTNMSEQDGLADVKSLVARALEWGHPALAITDHASVQAYIDAYAQAKEHGFKVISGMEAYVVDDMSSFCGAVEESRALSGEFVVFDIETTGFSARSDEIIEIGAVKVKGFEVVEHFSEFVNPGVPIPAEITELTGIDDSMVRDAEGIESVFAKFCDFVGDSPLVAHNADFDLSFVNIRCERFGKPYFTSIDTIELARQLLDIKRFGLSTVARHLKVSLENHHRAVDDANATCTIFLHFLRMLTEKGLSTIGEVNAYYAENAKFERMRASHLVLLMRNADSRIPLYELISDSNLKHFDGVPKILLSELMAVRHHFLIGSSDDQGMLYDSVLMCKPQDVIDYHASYLDFIELFPVDNFAYQFRKGFLKTAEQVQDINRAMVALADKLRKVPVATSNAHFLDPEDELVRNIVLEGRLTRSYENEAPLYYRTTDEMLREFSYLGDRAEEIVVDNSLLLASMTELVKPVPDETFPPTIPGADDDLRNICYQNAHALYGDQLPELVETRISTELNSIIKNGYASLYMISNIMVKKSLDDGYSVGSRGSVGSSLAAFLGGISDVNPLPPHYHCGSCKHTEFIKTPLVGADLEPKNCPVCGSELHRSGFDIPFEAFLGFKGEKEPDIDLNFAGVYQSTAQKYCEVLFGEGHTFKAGTIGTYADKTAYANVKKYEEARGLKWHPAYIQYLSNKINGVKKSSGQHPAGILVLPKGMNINQITPVTMANSDEGGVVTTHFDYHMISGRLLKLDVLGHESPTVLKLLHDFTGKDFLEIALDDAETLSIFSGVEALKLKKDIGLKVGTLGVPEFGTPFVLGMLEETKPKTVTDLVRISGLSHGTNVWLNNAREQVVSGEVPFNEVIATREDIMNKLIAKGADASVAFQIMEKVRKGKGVNSDDLAVLKKVDMPQWYIDSCMKISYLFPKAHAAAYVMQSIRIAHYKVHYPLAFYATYFTMKVADFDALTICAGEKAVAESLQAIENSDSKTSKDGSRAIVLRIAQEMYSRGIEMLPVDLMESDATNFRIVDGKLLPPLQAIQGIARAAALQVQAAREEGDFKSVEDFKKRTGINKTSVEALESIGAFEGLSKTNQMSFF